MFHDPLNSTISSSKVSFLVFTPSENMLAGSVRIQPDNTLESGINSQFCSTAQLMLTASGQRRQTNMQQVRTSSGAFSSQLYGVIDGDVEVLRRSYATSLCYFWLHLARYGSASERKASTRQQQIILCSSSPRIPRADFACLEIGYFADRRPIFDERFRIP
jgi:hypothetical protein